MTNTDRMHDEKLPLNQKQKGFENWIQHIKTIGIHSWSFSHLCKVSQEINF